MPEIDIDYRNAKRTKLLNIVRLVNGLLCFKVQEHDHRLLRNRGFDNNQA